MKKQNSEDANKKDLAFNRNSRFVSVDGDFEYVSPKDVEAGKRPHPPRVPKKSS